MPRNIIVELEPHESLATAFAATLAPSEAASGNASAPDLNLPGFRQDMSYPPVPAPHPVAEAMNVAQLDSFDVSSRLTVATSPLEVPYIVRGVLIDDGAMEQKIEELRKQDTVRNVYSDPQIDVCPVVCPTGPVGTAADVARLVGARALAQAGMDGGGVLLAIVDTGINLAHLRSLGLHPTTDARRSWKPANVPGQPFQFAVDHGTMCAFDALIAAPKATLLDIAVLQSRNSGFAGLLSDAVLAYAFLRALLTSNTRPGETQSLVISNSWGMFNPAFDFPVGDPGNYSDNPDHPFNRIVATLERLGADILFAAGNCGADCPDNRCAFGETRTICGANSHPAVLSVAGVTVRGDRVGYSSTGPGRLTSEKPDLAGFTHFRGSQVFSADGGTSAACPVVAGVVAAIRSKLHTVPGSGDGSPAGVRNLLRKTALEAGNIGFDFAFGWGIVNGLRLAQVVPGISVIADTETEAAVTRLESSLRGNAPSPAPSAFAALETAPAATGVKTILARLKTGGPIKSALISTPTEDVDFAGDDDNQTATIHTNSRGKLEWDMVLRTQGFNTSWSLTFTEKGNPEGNPDIYDSTDGDGEARPSGEKQF